MVVSGRSAALIIASRHHHALRGANSMSIHNRRHESRARLFSFTSDEHDAQERITALHKELQKLNVDATALSDANLQVVENPTNGYDGRYGKSAIKTYRSFLQPKSSDATNVNNISVVAGQVARQIDFSNQTTQIA